MTSLKFQTAYDEYIAALTKAGKGATHDYRRSIFLDFLGKAFDIKLGEVEIEEKLRVPEVRGFIDALYNSLIFEFKKDLKREHEDAMRELAKYFIARPDAPVALVTDGWTFDVYVPADAPTEQPRRVRGFVLRADNADEAHLFFDSYLFQDTDLLPTSDDVVMRFGAASPTYLSLAANLEKLWKRVEDKPVTRVKVQEWNRLLAKVYGTEVGSDDLFLRHTYLSILVRAFAAAALFGEEDDGEKTARGLVNGELFAYQGYPNLGESDFFAWILHPEIEAQSLQLVKMILGRLRVYDLGKVNEDLLKELYQNLIDPTERHDLGEHYTPDWLAEWTLREAGYFEKLNAGERPSLLDPSCGSGTFLFTALQLARQSGLSGHDLVEYALDKITGMDVHPLAVTISKVNLVLALGGDIKAYRDSPVRLGVFMADTIQSIEETGAGALIEIPVGQPKTDAKGKPLPSPEKFAIPESLARDRVLLEEVLEKMGEISRLNGTVEDLLESFWKSAQALGVPAAQKPFWRRNCSLLIQLVRENRDTIWTFILKNCFQPAFMRSHQVDFVVGNPPWLSLNGVQNGDYQAQIKKWTFDYGLLGRGETRLFTQMDLCTLFWAHCEAQFLRAGGTIAMVMPRSVLTGAKQHANFRARGFSKVLEVGEVKSYDPRKGYGAVFNVPSCALIAHDGAVQHADIAARHAAGKLGARNLGWDAAQQLLAFADDTYTPPTSDTPFSVYHPEIRNGANIFPRCFWLVHSRATGKYGVVNAKRPAIETDPDTQAQAKKPWKGQKISGNVEAEFLFATLLNDNLVPFGVRAFDLCVLPIRETATGCQMLNEKSAYDEGFTGLGDWLRDTEKVWNELKKETTTASSLDWLNYQRKLEEQHPTGGFRVIYNAAGSNLCACVVDGSHPVEAGGLGARGFVAEHVMFYFRTPDANEAHYLCALLNSPC